MPFGTVPVGQLYRMCVDAVCQEVRRQSARSRYQERMIGVGSRVLGGCWDVRERMRGGIDEDARDAQTPVATARVSRSSGLAPGPCSHRWRRIYAISVPSSRRSSEQWLARSSWWRTRQGSTFNGQQSTSAIAYNTTKRGKKHDQSGYSHHW